MIPVCFNTLKGGGKSFTFGGDGCFIHIHIGGEMSPVVFWVGGAIIFFF